MGRAWKRQFPNHSKTSIREYLLIFTDTFAFKSEDKLKFSPEDKILDVYHALYPLKGADHMELEDFAETIEECYSISFADIWNPELTLGELYEFTHP